MENFSAQANYVKRLTRVTSFIYDHLDGDLDLHALAEVAALSPYHWHRIYHAIYGETVAATVRRLRLQRAAADLARTTLPIEDIAARSGYESVASFNRVAEIYFRHAAGPISPQRQPHQIHSAVSRRSRFDV